MQKREEKLKGKASTMTDDDGEGEGEDEEDEGNEQDEGNEEDEEEIIFPTAILSTYRPQAFLPASPSSKIRDF